MPVFTAIATGVAAVAGAIGFSAAAATFVGGVAAFAARTLLTIGVSKLLSNRQGSDATGTQDAGARVQLPPATDNKLPVVYGSAYIAPIITDAKISTDQKTMWYVCALSEVTDAGTISFGEVYYDSKLVTFDGTDQTKVVSLTTNSSPAQVDTKVDGKLYMYFYNNGSNSPTNSSQTAIQVLQDAGIDPAYQWTSTDIMYKTAFVIVKVIYSQDAGTTNIGQLSVQLQNSLNRPGDVIYDYLQNTRYGCAVSVNKIDTVSLSALNTYSDQLLTYYPVGGGSATQPRYRINGPINTGNNCLNNIQQLVDSCDSWLQHSELTGKWKVVINKAYDQAPNAQTLGQLYSVNSSNLIGGIEVNPIDLNSTYNSLEVQYPNFNINDQTDFRIIDLTDPTKPWYDPNLLSPNEPDNRLVVQFPQVNNYIQGVYLGIRRLLQSREDLVINFALDYSGIQIEAGDVIKVTLSEYGWLDKLFRVSQVQEAKLEDGSLGVRISAFEYNSTVFNDNALDDFVPQANTGLTDPNIICTPGTPVVTDIPVSDGTIQSFSVSSTVPLCGVVLYMDFNYGTDIDPTTHKLYKTVSKGNGQAYAFGETVTITVNDLPPGDYYWSITARNNSSGSNGSSAPIKTWSGQNLTTYSQVIYSLVNSTGAVLTMASTAGIKVGMSVEVTSGVGTFAPNTIVTQILSATQVVVSAIPTVALVNATVRFFGGGLTTSQIADGAVTVDKVPANSGFGGVLSIYYTPAKTSGVIASASSTTTRNIALTLPAYNPSPNDIFPWAQGTSSTANGYAANSTGPFTPNAAATQIIYEGDSGWYKIALLDISSDPFIAGDTIQENGEFVFMTDTPNTVVQICSYFKFSTTAQDARVLTGQLQTAVIPYASPWPFPMFYNVASSVSSGVTVIELGLVGRNLTPGATLSVIHGTFNTKQNNG